MPIMPTDFTWPIALLTAALGVVCGTLNVLAAGGSLLAVPFLIFLGLPAPMANATNRVAILLQNTVSVGAYRHAGMVRVRRHWTLLLTMVVGGLLGALLATDVSEQLLNNVICAILVVMFFLMMHDPKRWESRGMRLFANHPWLRYVAYFVVGAYGGFIQMGVGFFLLALLELGDGLDLLRANAVKVLCILAFTAVAIVVFACEGLIVWRVGLTLACGNMIGAWIGVKYSMRLGSARLRYVLLAALALSAIYLFLR